MFTGHIENILISTHIISRDYMVFYSPDIKETLNAAKHHLIAITDT